MFLKSWKLFDVKSNEMNDDFQDDKNNAHLLGDLHIFTSWSQIRTMSEKPQMI